MAQALTMRGDLAATGVDENSLLVGQFGLANRFCAGIFANQVSIGNGFRDSLLEESMKLPSTSPHVPDFPLFVNLPKELRLVIWREVIEEPRIITCQHASIPSLGGPRYVFLSAIGSLFGQASYRTAGGTPNPAILQVCQESRSEALRFYQPFQHINLPSRVTYINPSLDVLSLEFGDLYSDYLFQAYGAQMDRIESLALNMWEWCAPFSGSDYIRHSSSHPTRLIVKLRGLRRVILRMRDFNVGSEWQSADTLGQVAKKFRDEYLDEKMRHEDWTVETIQVLDGNGRLF